MNKVLTFYVRIKGLEDKIWCKIENKEVRRNLFYALRIIWINFIII